MKGARNLIWWEIQNLYSQYILRNKQLKCILITRDIDQCFKTNAAMVKMLSLREVNTIRNWRKHITTMVDVYGSAYYLLEMAVPDPFQNLILLHC